MFVLRLVGLLLLIAIGATLAIYLVTRDRRYLRLAWQTLKFTFVIVVIVLAFLLFERLAMVV